MARFLSLCFVALAVAAGASAQNQTAAPARTSKPQDGKPVMMSGCLTGGPTNYTLANVAITPAPHEGAERPIATTGATLSYTLTARDGIDLGKHVGKKVEIRGMLLPPTPPPGSKTGAAELRMKEAMSPAVAVTAVRMLSGTCR